MAEKYNKIGEKERKVGSKERREREKWIFVKKRLRIFCDDDEEEGERLNLS